MMFAAGITDVAIVERGRNVVSSSRDGTARLWDCGKSACLVTYAAETVVNGCSLVATAATTSHVDLLQPDHQPSN
jgi:proteasomal ATPase-associated factor 1